LIVLSRCKELAQLVGGADRALLGSIELLEPGLT
jgi:hypothetical protein